MLAARSQALGVQQKYWTSPGVLDQRDTSMCVGFSAFKWLTSFPIKNVPALTPQDLYHQAQLIDEWPGEDYDGTSVRAAFKVLRSLGYVSEYRWATNLEGVVNHLLTVGPVVVGTEWTEGMFMADTFGYIDDIGGRSVGGHAYLLVGANRKRWSPNGTGAVRILNSWGPNWSDKGRAWMSFKCLDWLLGLNGEACTAQEIKKL